MSIKTGLKRDTIDKFYTNQNAVKLCINWIKSKIKIKKNDLIIEPSAGNGAFISEIKTLSNNYRFYDIKPENEEIVKTDYLELDEKLDFERIHIIGNPPFGRQSSMAIKFIKKSSFFNTISFILPKSFKKESMRKHFPLNFHLIFEHDIPENSFLIDGEISNVETVFQIWERKDFNRELPQKLNPIGFQFVNKNDNPDIAFRRVGICAGNIDKNFKDKSEQSHYFIKFDGNVDEILEKLENIKFEEGNTVGPKSIGKQEVIKEFNKQIYKNQKIQL